MLAGGPPAGSPVGRSSPAAPSPSTARRSGPSSRVVDGTALSSMGVAGPGGADNTGGRLAPPHPAARAPARGTSRGRRGLGDGKLPARAPPAGEHQVSAVGGPGRILTGAASLRELSHLPGGQIDDGDVEAPGFEGSGVGDLAELLRRIPRAAVVVAADGREAPDVEAFAVHDPDLRRPRAVGGEGDLLGGRAPARRGVLGRGRREAPLVCSVCARDPDVHAPRAVAGEGEATPIGAEGGREGLAVPPLAGEVRDASALEDTGQVDERPAPPGGHGGAGGAVRAPDGQGGERGGGGGPRRGG